MKPFSFYSSKRVRQGGFSLAETAFSLGLFSFGFLLMAPLLGLGLRTARYSQDDRSTAQIAATLIEEAKQGTLAAGTIYFDGQGTSCSSAQAVYSAQTTSSSLTPLSSRLSVQVTPLGAPNRVRTYAAVVQAPQ
jgi:uncharacterized protein (TIGR02598 family)